MQSSLAILHIKGTGESLIVMDVSFYLMVLAEHICIRVLNKNRVEINIHLRNLIILATMIGSG